MNLPWSPVICIDIVGSTLVLLLACWCAVLARRWSNEKPDDVFRNYLHLLTLAIVIFALSRSFGHLVKQLLLLGGHEATWRHIAPFSGAINSATFVVIFAFGIYFHRFQRVHAEIEYFKNNLEEMIERRTAELNQSKHTLENILNNSNPINITSVNFDLIQANAAYYALWPKSKPGAEKCYESRPGSHCHTDLCPLQQIIDGHEEASHEITKTVNGSPREFIATARAYRDVDGTLLGMVESFQDITLRKRAEQVLIDMDRIKNEFISTAAHELSTPLSAMMGYAELLRDPEAFGTFSDAQKREFLNEVYDRGEALNRIVDDLLDISRIESGNPLPLDRQPTDLVEVLRKKARLFLTADSGHTIRLDLPEQAESTLLRIDRHRIDQALDNLLSNAVKYSPAEKEIFLKARPTCEGWEVRVEDQGRGMNPEQLERVFDKFYRADASNTAAGGLGLGMSIVRQIIEAHGGQIRVESVVGQGTSVIFTLPYDRPQSPG